MPFTGHDDRAVESTRSPDSVYFSLKSLRLLRGRELKLSSWAKEVWCSCAVVQPLAVAISHGSEQFPFMVLVVAAVIIASDYHTVEQ